MSIRASVALEHEGRTFTNLDNIQGVINLNLKSSETLNSIQIKLEGVSKSIVPIPREETDRRNHQNESKKDAIEMHKFLYQTLTVFPPPEIRSSSSSQQYTLPSGSHKFDFSFKMPMETSCMSNPQQSGMLSRFVFNSGGVDFVRQASSHKITKLPPSISGMDDLASIRYYLKITVNRASFLKVNSRTYEPLVVLPLDDPKSIQPQRLAFVRRELVLPIGEDLESAADNRDPKGKKSQKQSGGGGFFKSLFGIPAPIGTGGRSPTMNFSFEARYPAQGNFIPLKRLPINLYLVFPYNPREWGDSIFFLDELTFTLFAVTTASAQNHQKRTVMSLDIFSRKSIMNAISVSKANHISPEHRDDFYEIEIDSDLFKDAKLPDIVAPTFEICNISRTYNFEIKAGFRSSAKSRPYYVSLVSDVTVLSGIHQPSTNASSDYPAPPRPPRKTSTSLNPPDDSSSEVPPSYDEVVSSISAVEEVPRREYGQDKSYYSNYQEYDQ